MSFPRYTRYKDSGVQSLGEVPEHWEVCALKRIVRMQSGEAITAERIEEAGGYPVFGGNGMRGFTSEFTHDGNFVLIGRQGALCGNINYGRGKFWASEHAVVASAVKQIDTVWLGEMLRSMNLNQYSVSAAQPGLSVDLVGRLKIVVPPFCEQIKIGELLNLETAQIDELVAEQQRLIELLKEKRQAVISHAVTKGLNPDAPMKPSGIEWLGDVPEHWQTVLLKRAFRSVDYGISDALDSEGAVAILRMGNISNGKVITDDLKYADYVDPSLLLRSGDLLYNRTNSLDLIGKVGMFIGDADSAVSFASYLVRLRTVDESMPDYFAYLLNTEGILGLARANAFVAIGQCNLNPTRYGQIIIAIPPLDEQIAIVHYLNTETAKLDTLTAEAQRAIDLLRERRSALISAAVTGQIDVRGLAESEAA
jgi:type I restriction enzyme S subunit